MNDGGRSGPQKLLTRQLLQREVRDRKGRRLGHLADLVVHASTGRVEFGRLVFEDARSPGVAFLDVPWSQFVGRNGYLELDVSRAVLERVARVTGGEPPA